MPEWSLYGYERKENFEKDLTPDELAYTLVRYQNVLGQEFGICELLQVEKIKALALIAEAINDVPEFLMDQLGKARHYSEFHALSSAIESVAEAIQESNE